MREQAERWARRKAAVLGRDAAVVNRYYMKDDMYDLRVKSFDEDLMDWIDFKVLVQILCETEQELFG